MSLLRNKKAVEGLPLKYIIIALVAAICVGIALQFTGVLKTGILSTAEKINESTTMQTTCALDAEAPVIEFATLVCNSTTHTATVTATVTDDCGVADVWAYIDNGADDIGINFDKASGADNRDATWTGSETDTTKFSGTNEIEGYIYADDKANTANTISFEDAYYVTANCTS
ncbi:MAG: hypothetical protein PHC66_03235 [Candidatus Nanoarchaeia archaeon]|nr:hypothetical protein [Candidatus Nanoarchaeia archaeon]MDD5239448.1 hypothetical protein [Candidatus Nanoarchaeia archaeon]